MPTNSSSAGRQLLRSVCPHCREKILHRFVGGIYVPKTTRVDKKAVFKLRDKGHAVREISEKFNVTPGRIFQILRGRTA